KSKSFNPDIIFLDIKMPGINGIEAARIIKEADPAVSLIFLTAFNQFDYAQEAIQIGVDDFIIKPSSENRVLEVITKLITKIDNRKSDLDLKENNKLKLSRATGYLENEFIYNLSVRGITEEKFESYLSILDIDFYSARAGIVKILFDTYPIHVDSSYQKQVLKKRCAFILKSSLGKSGILTYFNIDLSNIYFLLSLDREKNNNLENQYISSLISEATREIKKTINIEVIIGIGSVFTNPSKALSSFSSAKNDLGRLPENEKSFLPNQEDEITLFPINLEIGMEQAVLSGKRNDVLEIFQQISEWFESSTLSFEEKKKNMIELVTVLKHAAAYQLPDGKCLIDESELMESTESVDLLSSINMFLNDLLERISGINEIENSPAIDKACKFIDNNFKNDISLEETASHCRLSSFYFSKLFKKRKKSTFIDYLTNRRIEEAKRLLTETNLSIKEISCKVGYNDPNYFTRVFRRVLSTSPSSFRSKKMLREQ
ncbi:MAG: helix-turn-helix domain-containing protein, partial [Spirochaetales bacterium]|nr:helix-turn-helix domain-containing protein [Spirochaetales bacterium]